MPDEGVLHTVGVFANPEWGRKGIDALLADNFAPDSISLLALDSPESSALAPQPLDKITVEVRGLGHVVASGPLLSLLQDAGFERAGLGSSLRRAGFQAHDGRIFEILVARGGVLVSVASSRRAADALAKLHAYGAANAAIGAWAGRV